MQQVHIGSSILDDRDHALADLLTPFSKWHRRDKRRFVERFCTIAVPENQNAKTKNLQLTCNCCGKKFMGQIMTAMVHLSGMSIAGQRMSACPTPNEDIKAEILHMFSPQEYVEEQQAATFDGQIYERQETQPKQKRSAAPKQSAKRKRDTDQEARTLAVNPFNPTDMAVLRFLSESGLKPDIVETESFQSFVREIRKAPANYVLPPLLKPAPLRGNEHSGMSQQLHMQHAQHHQQQQQQQMQQMHQPHPQLQMMHSSSSADGAPQQEMQAMHTSSLPVADFGAHPTGNEDDGEQEVGDLGDDDSQDSSGTLAQL